MKKLLILVVCVFSLMALTGCQSAEEKQNAKIARLEKAAKEARAKADQAQAELNLLEYLFGK